jgi:preprotein translocase subunit SecA
MLEHPLKPGLKRGHYPQKQEAWPSLLERQTQQVLSTAKQVLRRHQYKLNFIVNKVNSHEPSISKLTDSALQEHIGQLRINLQRHGLQKKWIYQSFATIREVSYRALGKRHFDVQLLGGWVLLNGLIAEMATGEGKTLTATLASCTAALAGIPVHVMTANDYLATRDEQLLRPLYQWLGITSASIIDGMPNEIRIQAYKSDIIHATSQQIAFDYLRDRMEMGDDIGKLQIQFNQIQCEQQQKPMPFRLRGLCFAIIDEADSLLIDEAKTPLIISSTRQNEEQNQIYCDANYLATSLAKKTDFIINEQNQNVSLTAAGKNKITELAMSLDAYWKLRKRREFMVTLALKANYLFRRDEHYLVRDNKVEIIDALTGRVMPDRSWEQGLHQLIEAKEGCEITGERDSMAKISYQKFFNRYLRLSGMSGTVTEVTTELKNIYGLHVIKIPTHRLSRREMTSERVYKTDEQKWQAFINRIEALHQQGRPILIGTQTVADSEKVSALLYRHDLPHQVLNAQQDRMEAKIIAKAGQLDSITVATNMAGRGTDIALGEGVEAVGGLHVISTGRNEARRIDRQLYGRCARQGDPGSAEAYLSLQDEKLIKFYSSSILKIIAGFCQDNQSLPDWLGNIIQTIPQKCTEYKHARVRRLLIDQEQQQANTLAFTGRME